MNKPPMARASWGAFGVLAIAVFLAVLDLFIVNIAFPAIRGSFPSASLSDLSWILSAYAIVFAAGLVPAGKLADIVGRRGVRSGGARPQLVLDPGRPRDRLPRGARPRWQAGRHRRAKARLPCRPAALPGG